MLQNNGMEGNVNFPPLLTNNPYLEDMSMAKNTLPQSASKRKPKKIRLYMRRPILPGERYGYLTVIKESTDTLWSNGDTCRRAECLCDCGTTKIVPVYGLWAGSTKSCGCLQLKNLEMSTEHGLKKHPLYGVWRSMKKRCLDPNNIGYKNYGGRGITICPEWVNNVEAFYNFAISHGWREGLLIDREDNDKGYSPDNCRFVDNGLSTRNTRLLNSRNTSGYRGVCLVNTEWKSGIGFNNKWIHLGYFPTAIEAAFARDAKAIELNAGHVLNFNRCTNRQGVRKT